MATYSCRFISNFCMKSSSVFRSLPSSLSLSSVFSRPPCHPNCDRSTHTPLTPARFSLLTASSRPSTSRVAVLKGTSLTTKGILVSVWRQSPTKYLLFLMSCRYSNSSREQKLKGGTGQQIPCCIDQQQYIIMNTNLQVYKNLRVYRHLSFYGILNALLCNRLMKSATLVAASPALYRIASRFPGKTITHFVIGNTFNRVFTGGDSLAGVERATAHLAEKGIPIIIDYCAEGVRDHLDSEKKLDQNAILFRQSAIAAAQLPNQLYSIKISALVSTNLLEKYNRAVELRDRIWQEYSSEGQLTAQGLFDAAQRIYPGISTEDIAAYLKTVHDFQGDIEAFSIGELEFKMNHHPYHLYDSHRNDCLFVNLLLPLDKTEKQQMGSLRRRLDEVLNKEFDNPNNVRVLIDAEQSFLQRAIECIAEQIQAKYNQHRPYAINTLQNYLKIAQKRADYQLEVTKRRNLHLAIKLVRGAYLVEQTKVSKENGNPTPIADSFEATTANYLRNFQLLAKQDMKGVVFVATHNEQALQTLLKMKEQASPTIEISFAQLFGLGDHLTYLLKQQRQQVYKLLPWASTEVMIGYLIRRAQQLSQTNYPLGVQYCLLKDELFTRTLHG